MQNDTTIRVYRFRLYPTKPQEAAMFETLRLSVGDNFTFSRSWRAKSLD